MRAIILILNLYNDVFPATNAFYFTASSLVKDAGL